MSRCPLCGTHGGQELMLSYMCVLPGCDNYAGLDNTIELIDAGEPAEFDEQDTEPLSTIPVAPRRHQWGYPKFPSDSDWSSP